MDRLGVSPYRARRRSLEQSQIEGRSCRRGSISISSTSFHQRQRADGEDQRRRPATAWTDLLRYFDLTGEGKPATIEEARKQFDGGLDLMATEKVIEKWEWGEDGGGGLELTVHRGSRGLTG